MRIGTAHVVTGTVSNGLCWKLYKLMKLSKRTIDDLLTMIRHTRIDISYDGGGSYNKGDSNHSHDPKDARKSERAIEFIKKLIIENQ